MAARWSNTRSSTPDRHRDTSCTGTEAAETERARGAATCTSKAGIPCSRAEEE